ncbi:MAG: maleylpyruvate isomerase family mycothiol-dependent enzyme [Actinobacteria bacterium]|nr:maleylpyruvate isomerase family mycothiol-dependent enzyme [Actinomycetota bacterium]
MDAAAEVATRRRAIADVVETLDADQLDHPSWCEGWQVRDVIGHLVHLAEATQISMLRDVARNGILPDKGLAAVGKEIGARPADELASRLRDAADGTYHVPGTPMAVIVGEVLVHAADALRPLDLEPPSDPAVAAELIPTYRRFGRVAFHATPTAKVTLVATDTDLRIGSGPEVRGRAIDLLLLSANRAQVLDRLDGPGTAVIADRASGS